jgi:hypothetical protein
MSFIQVRWRLCVSLTYTLAVVKKPKAKVSEDKNEEIARRGWYDRNDKTFHALIPSLHIRNYAPST